MPQWFHFWVFIRRNSKQPWLVLLSWLCIVLQTERSQVQFPVRVRGSFRFGSWLGCVQKPTNRWCSLTWMFLSLFPSLLKNNKKKKSKALIQKDMYSMFIEALFTIAKIWKQPKCLLTDNWAKKMWYTYVMEYYLAIRKNEILPFVTKRMSQIVLC